MSADTIEAFVAYATTPIYVFGLLCLVYLVAILNQDFLFPRR